MVTVTSCTPTLPYRGQLLERAVLSIRSQTRPVDAIAVAFDTTRGGAWETRNRAMLMAQTDWIAFLDDDDEWLPHHIERCLQVQAETGVDVVVPWYDVVGGSDPTPGHRYLQLDPAGLHSFGITCLVRREFVMDHGIRFLSRNETGAPEDWVFWLTMAEKGATFHQIPETTWLYHHHGTNTSGRPEVAFP